MNNTLSPLNVIFLNDSQHDSKEEIINSYIKLLNKCKTESGRYECLSSMYDETVMKTGELIIEKQIRKNAEILDDLREYR